jgi:PAS domain S-box-containing protein
LPPQLDAVIALGMASDWDAVRLRLANEKAPLEASTSELVRNVQRQVSDELAQSVVQHERLKRRILLIVPSTALVTLLASTFLIVVVTSSISAPLRQLMRGSAALARGDFDHQVRLSGNDELAHLGAVFNETTTKLRELYRKLQSSEAYLAEAQRLTHMASWAWEVADRNALHLSDEWYRIYGFDPGKGMPPGDELLQRVHPEDRGEWQETIERAIAQNSEYEVEFRILLPDGKLKWVRTVGHPVLSPAGELVQFVGSSMDITERKHAEEELQQLVDFVRHIITVLSPNGKITYANRVAREYTGLTLDEYRSVDVIARVIHPDDIERMRAVRERGLSANNPFEIEARTVGKDGLCQWFLYRYNPLRDEHGQITRWYVAGTDIEDRKRAEERLQQENVALRQEIGRASMFEEIVGTSKPLKAVLRQTAKVAPTDSTVLITGETGTGKELIARVVHKRSQRSEHAFISVNCAAFAPALISSELFGHEKGAFTGATQRRLGRFELADGGTIFLDEVGELPPDTQVALLRVLQEREFERVGGTQSIKVDVRVIAATNRDLIAAVSGGSFRSDLFYRLQVFPIEIPPLRERRDDIPLLVEYFIDRYARKAGKNIRHISQETLELLQSYAWPGNIRELQNVIERSVILCETETFSIDESWLPKQPQPFLTAKPKNRIELPRRLEEQEKDMIEEALKASRGRVFGPTGAAAKLGIPRSTLESKIKSLKIDKNRFRSLSEI